MIHFLWIPLFWVSNRILMQLLNSHTLIHTNNQTLNSPGLNIIKAVRIYFCIWIFLHAVICIVVCLLDIFLFILSTVMFFPSPWDFLFPQTDGLDLSFSLNSFQCFYRLCKQLNQNLQKIIIKKTSATCWEIGTIVEFEMIPPWALQAEAQGFKQLQA